MQIKDGVSLGGIWPQIVVAMIVADQIYKKYDKDMVVTSGTEGSHMQNSLHYQGLAIDIRTRYFSTDTKLKVVQDIRDALNTQYDILMEEDHIHIEFDPKKA